MGDLSGGEFFSYARAVSADGSVIVGDSITAAGSEAFIWDSANGLRNLRDVLIGLGDNLTGWRLDARGISADGTTIVGLARHVDGRQEAYVARLGPAGVAVPEPSSLMLLGLGILGLLGYGWKYCKRTM